MEAAKEILDSSTIHGLSHISGSRSIITRLGWTIVVLSSFVVAAILIQNSFDDWEESPVVTTIETKEISEVLFPNIIVCPPHGSNTAVNYDLLKAENMTNMDFDSAFELFELIEDVAQDEYIMPFVEKISSDTSEQTIKA